MHQGAFLMRRLEHVRGEFSLTVLAYTIRTTITLVGVQSPIAVTPGTPFAAYSDASMTNLKII
jgi:hypothetical protein